MLWKAFQEILMPAAFWRPVPFLWNLFCSDPFNDHIYLGRFQIYIYFQSSHPSWILVLNFQLPARISEWMTHWPLYIQCILNHLNTLKPSSLLCFITHLLCPPSPS
jgi:hypothetical protein